MTSAPATAAGHSCATWTSLATLHSSTTSVARPHQLFLQSPSPSLHDANGGEPVTCLYDLWHKACGPQTPTQVAGFELVHGGSTAPTRAHMVLTCQQRDMLAWTGAIRGGQVTADCDWSPIPRRPAPRAGAQDHWAAAIDRARAAASCAGAGGRCRAAETRSICTYGAERTGETDARTATSLGSLGACGEGWQSKRSGCRSFASQASSSVAVTACQLNGAEGARPCKRPAPSTHAELTNENAESGYSPHFCFGQMG